MLLANKCDLDVEIDRPKLDAFCEAHGFSGWFDTSAKLNINIEEGATFLVEQVLQHREVFIPKERVPGTFTPGSDDQQSTSSCC